jgi:hypothetical protein
MKVGGKLHSLAALFLGKEPPVPIGYEAGWVPEPLWTLARREKSLVPAGNRTFNRPAFVIMVT